ncbi:hypothetical protein GCM10011351_02130 [Paraliobacillus quinghaiensis]|uniref:DUF58 domain-containing protein n=1 Tax=Paraliobacillus quinghaiensis TaxID=470815 RepID=A0A917TF15_9BACI|nr:DUF58 domain-containing protein [Paraliobacillus quinghaiensis]GGM19839.1 hypothetical protein GCM10011351_02130 [Paraliobacillus quinghaiensis]
MNIAWFIIVTLLFIFVQSVVFRKWGLHGITYQRSFNKREVFAGQKVKMIDEIANKKALPLPWVRLESKINKNLLLKQLDDDVSDNLQFHRTLFSFLPYQKITRRHEVTCLKRGIYPLQSVSLSIGDLFGFGGQFKQFETSAVLTVYPNLLDLHELPLPAHSFLGEQSVKRWIMDDPFMKVGTRNYHTSDPIHSINWKASARTNQLQVNLHDYTADNRLMILLNVDQSDDVWLPIQNEDLLEQSITYAASTAHYAIKRGIETGFSANAILEKDKNLQIKPSVHVPIENGEAHFYELLEIMAQLTNKRSGNFHHLLEEIVDNQVNQTDFLIITSRVTVQMKQQIERLKRQGNAVDIMWMNSEEGEQEKGEKV